MIVKADNQYVMAVLPSHEHIDIELLRQVIGADQINIAREEELISLFPLCETGGMPALGRLFGLPVYLDKSLMDQEWIAFNAGSHTEVLAMDLDSFSRVEHPTVCSFIRMH